MLSALSVRAASVAAECARDLHQQAAGGAARAREERKGEGEGAAALLRAATKVRRGWG